MLRFLTFVRLVDRAAAAITPPVLDVTPTPRLVDDNVVVDDDADEKRRAISSTGQDVKCHTLAALLLWWSVFVVVVVRARRIRASQQVNGAGRRGCRVEERA